MFDIIEHVPKNNELEVLKEVNRILRKRGILLLSTPNSHLIAKLLDPAWYFGHRHYSIDQILRMLKKASFKIEKIEARGDFFSSFYLLWFYLFKRVKGTSQPRNKTLERLDDLGYDKGNITDIFLVARKI